MRNYTLKQIQTFMEVARQGSVSKAAERLFVTQPAVSMHIRQLEDAFGVALFEPQGRGIRLTDAGHAFAGRATAVMAELHELESLMAEHAGAKQGRIALAVVTTAKYFVPMLLVRFGQLFPGIDVVLRIDPGQSASRIPDLEAEIAAKRKQEKRGVKNTTITVTDPKTGKSVEKNLSASEMNKRRLEYARQLDAERYKDERTVPLSELDKQDKQ